MTWRENGKRKIVVQLNVRGRDLNSFAQDAQQKVERDVRIPPGSWLVWGGQYENLQAAKVQLLLVVPLAFAVIFGLLYLGLGGVVPAAVGFIALSGVAVLNGLVMMSSIRKRMAEGLPVQSQVGHLATINCR